MSTGARITPSQSRLHYSTEPEYDKQQVLGYKYAANDMVYFEYLFPACVPSNLARVLLKQRTKHACFLHTYVIKLSNLQTCKLLGWYSWINGQHWFATCLLSWNWCMGMRPAMVSSAKSGLCLVHTMRIEIFTTFISSWTLCFVLFSLFDVSVSTSAAPCIWNRPRQRRLHSHGSVFALGIYIFACFKVASCWQVQLMRAFACIDKHESGAGKLVTVKGTVIRQLPARPVVFQIQYSCTKCGEVMDIECPDGRVKQPTACTATGCKSKSFQPSMASVVTEDWQKIRIQELLNVEHGAGHSSAARTLEVELSIDCVGCCMCGDVRTPFPVLKTYLLE